MSITQKTLELFEHAERLRAEIRAEISKAPQNPRVKEMGRNCVIVRARDLMDNWSPEYHDFRFQYQRILETLDKTPAEKIAGLLRRAVNTGHFGVGRRTAKLHPDVIEFLRGIL